MTLSGPDTLQNSKSMASSGRWSELIDDNVCWKSKSTLIVGQSPLTGNVCTQDCKTLLSYSTSVNTKSAQMPQEMVSPTRERNSGISSQSEPKSTASLMTIV